jgi:Holliday junction resolvase RusA-like endonuclease
MSEVVVKFTVPLPPITKKNSQRIVMRGNKPIILPSEKYKEYEDAALWFIPKRLTIDFPVNVKCIFYMPNNRLCDLTNHLEAIDDVMVKAGLLKDDNYKIIASHDGSRVMVDKNNPRTEVEITKT